MAGRTSILAGGLALCALCCVNLCACRGGSGESAARLADARHAQCLVCKSEGDLACVDVTIHDDTPRTVYHGETFYFCSTQCRADFEKHPGSYLRR